MLQNLSFKRKISLLVVCSLVCLSLFAGLCIEQARTDITDGRKEALRNAVQTARNIVAGYQAAAAAGTLSEADAKKAAHDAVKLARYGSADGKTNYFYIVTTDGIAVMHPFNKNWVEGQSAFGHPNAFGIDTVRELVKTALAAQGDPAYQASMVARPGDTAPDATLYPKLQYLVTVPGWNWIIGSGLYMDDVDGLVRAAAIRTISICLAFLAVIGGLGITITRQVLRQLGGDPAEAIDIVARVAAGDLTVTVPDSAQDSLLGGLKRMVQAVHATVAQVRASTDSINTASSEIAVGNRDLSGRTELAASSLQETASAMEQLTGNVRQSADASRTADQLAASAAEVAQRGGAVVAQVVETMQQIHDSSRRIADIIGVIDGIAFQTNILALNAAVEAARAGEQGRGFAVVASEVRSLAQRSAGAAKEIKGLIGSSVDRVEAGSRLVADAGSTMNEIVASVQRVSDIMGEITAATTQQSQGIGQVNTSVSRLDQMTQQNAALVEESTAAAESLKDQAARLARAVSTFQLAHDARQALGRYPD
jgi:methyl-accepting chemotaxis protein